jgi:hypothetical protein
MSPQLRLLAALGVVGGAAVVLAPLAGASVDGCESGQCDLISGGEPHDLG